MVTRFAERAVPHESLLRPDRAAGTARCVRHIAASQAWPLSTGTPLRYAFFKRVAIALEGEAFTLEGLTERFDLAGHRFSKDDLHALRNLGKGQRLDSRHLEGRSDHRVTQCRRTATVMAAHQAAHPAIAPCVRPVIDRLPAHTELQRDDLRLDPAPEHQQARCSRARVPMFVIDRQLLQRCFLGLAQFDNTLHPLPRHHGGARLATFKQIYQEHLLRKTS